MEDLRAVIADAEELLKADGADSFPSLTSRIMKRVAGGLVSLLLISLNSIKRRIYYVEKSHL